jgi:hypothetical protein
MDALSSMELILARERVTTAACLLLCTDKLAPRATVKHVSFPPEGEEVTCFVVFSDPE